MKLIWVHFSYFLKRWQEEIRVCVRYYSNGHFFLIDQMLRLYYLLKSPYRISKQFSLKTCRHDPYTYGETPLTTLDFIMRKCQILSHDVVYDLGCGTGVQAFGYNLLSNARPWESIICPFSCNGLNV